MKTNELTGVALDWAVAKITNPEWWADGYMDGDPMAALDMDDGNIYSPSTDWAQGGPIIEREWLQVTPWPNESDEDMRWHCVQHDAPVQCHAFGPTPLIAAMRCYVASKMGDEIEIPEGLK